MNYANLAAIADARHDEAAASSFRRVARGFARRAGIPGDIPDQSTAEGSLACDLPEGPPKLT